MKLNVEKNVLMISKKYNVEKEKINTNTFENGMIKVNKLEGNIEIKDLNYHYPNSLPIVLENFNITIRQYRREMLFS